MSARSGIKSTPPSDKGGKPTSSKSTQARAKAEAAKVRLRYARQEAVLKMLQAIREAEIQKEQAIREAEIQKEQAIREAEIQKEQAIREAERAAREAERAARKAEAAKVQLRYARQEAVLKMKQAAGEAERAAREAEIQKEKAAREAERAARKAEAAKVRLRYARQEAVLKMKLATREAEIQKEKAAREAETQLEMAKISTELQVLQLEREEEAAREAEIQKEKAARQRKAAAREAETQLEMAKISTELQVLQLEREEEAAMAEAEYIEEAEGSRDLTEARSTLERTRLDRTSDYVQSQIDRQARLPSPYVFDNFPSYEEPQRVMIASHPYEEENLPSWLRDEVKNERADNRYSLTPNLQSSMRRDAEVESRMANSMRNVRSQSYRRQRTSPARMPLTADPTLQYLARRDLVTSGLYQFDDKPENYRAWLSTFTNVIDGVQLSATQRLDLMAKWLGKESRDQVRRIRSVYINKPELALSEAWDRLWERYGAPEIIEAALYRRLENFPKVSAKDHFKLREFGDLLMEIQGAKEDGYSAGLVYLDTPSGIRQIVDKLPFGLQDRWLTVASEYKEGHGGRFPPFKHLTEFVRKEAKRRNDPSLVGPGSSSIYTKLGRSSSNVFNIDKPVSVLKTEALTTNNDPGKYCPLHNKPHPLKACRMFREKPLEERTALLKEKRICFRCCSSTSHLARECTIAVKCLECDSPDHVGAMHPDLSPQTDSAPSPPQQDGGEGEAHSRSTVVSTNCTEVCGQA
ncbi:myosin-9-like isoform X2 [Hypanus sabinus]|uniref:myosin-9-like isoform X2 n=1 Tax=Hypanus sabinus TaxID=79690 RepID=UPI0028C4A411|nr:myosin-9-like isoform X2 [Hypanus sabinus]